MRVDRGQREVQRERVEGFRGHGRSDRERPGEWTAEGGPEVCRHVRGHDRGYDAAAATFGLREDT